MRSTDVASSGSHAKALKPSAGRAAVGQNARRARRPGLSATSANGKAAPASLWRIVPWSGVGAPQRHHQRPNRPDDLQYILRPLAKVNSVSLGDGENRGRVAGVGDRKEGDFGEKPAAHKLLTSLRSIISWRCVGENEFAVNEEDRAPN